MPELPHVTLQMVDFFRDDSPLLALAERVCSQLEERTHDDRRSYIAEVFAAVDAVATTQYVETPAPGGTKDWIGAVEYVLPRVLATALVTARATEARYRALFEGYEHYGGSDSEAWRRKVAFLATAMLLTRLEKAWMMCPGFPKAVAGSHAK